MSIQQQIESKSLVYQASTYHSLLNSLPNGHMITQLYTKLDSKTFKEACEYIWENTIDSLFLACSDDIKEEIKKLNDLNKNEEIQEIFGRLIMIEPYYLEIIANSIKK